MQHYLDMDETIDRHAIQRRCDEQSASLLRSVYEWMACIEYEL